MHEGWKMFDKISCQSKMTLMAAVDILHSSAKSFRSPGNSASTETVFTDPNKGLQVWILQFIWTTSVYTLWAREITWYWLRALVTFQRLNLDDAVVNTILRIFSASPQHFMKFHWPKWKFVDLGHHQTSGLFNSRTNGGSWTQSFKLL